MRHLSYILIGLIQISSIYAQDKKSADDYVAIASLYHLQKDHVNAIANFEAAFKIKQPDALNAYKAAGVYSLDSNVKMSAYYLQKAIQIGWTETAWLMNDPYFEYFKKAEPHLWSKLTAEARKKELAYEKTLKLPELRKKINLMVLSDQQLRYQKIQTKDKNELKAINFEIAETGKKNLAEAKNILNTYGWPKISEIGKDAQNNLWLITQHADHDIRFQEEALNKMKLLLKSDELILENYAFLMDRVLCNLNYLQEYGTQVNWTHHGMASGFRSIRNEWDADNRRKKLGLTSLATYSLNYGFKYERKTEEQYKYAQKQIKQQVKKLIDTALIAFKNGDFLTTYDRYNSASTFSDGMSNAETFKAAIVFAMIADKEKDQRYKDIAFDFLNLLYLRNKLKKSALSSTDQFKVLHDDPRWVKLLS